MACVSVRLVDLTMSVHQSLDGHILLGFRSLADVPSGISECGERSPLYAATRSEGFGNEVKKRVLLGTHALSAEYASLVSGLA